jgi:hypothetical protein
MLFFSYFHPQYHALNLKFFPARKHAKRITDYQNGVQTESYGTAHDEDLWATVQGLNWPIQGVQPWMILSFM